MHAVPAVLADEGQSGAGVRRLKLERPVCSAGCWLATSACPFTMPRTLRVPGYWGGGEQHLREHPDDFGKDLDRYADRDDEELGTPVSQGSGLSVRALPARRWVAGTQQDAASTPGIQRGAGRGAGPTACLVRSREACRARRLAAPNLRSARVVSTGRIRKLGCSTQVGT
jgi:hypothetical protein